MSVRLRSMTPLVIAVVSVTLCLGLATWKALDPATDWLASHGADMIAALAGAAAFGFVAFAAQYQARQVRSQELLTAFELSRGDLEVLTRRIAIAARLVVDVTVNNQPGKLPEREIEFAERDRSAFARLFQYGARIQRAISGANSNITGPQQESLRRLCTLYVMIFDGVLAFAPDEDLRAHLCTLPLGRAYCALKIALGQDTSGEHRALLSRIEPEIPPIHETDAEQP